VIILSIFRKIRFVDLEIIHPRTRHWKFTARDVVVSLCVEVTEEHTHRAADTTCLIPASLRGGMTFSAVFCGELIQAATNGCEDTIKAAAAYMALNRVHSGLVSNIQRAREDIPESEHRKESTASIKKSDSRAQLLVPSNLLMLHTHIHTNSHRWRIFLKRRAISKSTITIPVVAWLSCIWRMSCCRRSGAIQSGTLSFRGRCL